MGLKSKRLDGDKSMSIKEISIVYSFVIEHLDDELMFYFKYVIISDFIYNIGCF
jgi:hypothetical protein